MQKIQTLCSVTGLAGTFVSFLVGQFLPSTDDKIAAMQAELDKKLTDISTQIVSHQICIIAEWPLRHFCSLHFK